MPNIIDNEELYNVIVLGGQTSPGKVTLSGHNRKVVWTVKQGPFMNGANISFNHIPPIEFTATFYLLRDTSQGIDDFAAWPAFLNLINSTVSNPLKPKALSIYHPDLATNDIKDVVKAEVGGTTYDEKGGATIAVKFQEYRIAKKQDGAPQSAPNNSDPQYIKDLNKQLNALTNQYQNTPYG
jgi:hypothetical protein